MIRKEKRDRILKSAVTVFAREGFFNAKMANIAKEAGVATGTTYLYFENKDDLLISVFEEEMSPVIRRMNNCIARETNPTDKIRKFVSEHMRMVQDHPDMAQLLVVESRASYQFIHEYSGSKFRDYLNIIGEIFQEGQASGLFRKDVQATIFKQALFGAIDQISTTWALSKTKKLDLIDVGDQITSMVIDGIVVCENQ